MDKKVYKYTHTLFIMGKKRSEKRVVKNKSNKWHCLNCSKYISPNEKQVTVITKDNGKVVEEVYFHFPCWIKYFNDRVSLVAKANIQKMQEQVMTLVNNPMISGILSQVQGSGSLMSMLNLPLSVDKVVSKNVVKRKIENGRKKRGKTKNKMQKV
jgi:hypothetical protein